MELCVDPGLFFVLFPLVPRPPSSVPVVYHLRHAKSLQKKREHKRAERLQGAGSWQSKILNSVS